MKYLLSTVVLLGILGFIGCSEPTCEGKPRSYWLKQAKDKDSGFRTEAVSALGELAAENPSAKRVVLKALGDESIRVRMQALRSVSTLAKSDSQYTSHLIDALDDDDTLVRLTAIESLDIGPNGAEACVPLTKILNTSSEKMQDAIIAALESMGTHAKDSVPALEVLLESRRKNEQKLAQDVGVLREVAQKMGDLQDTSDLVQSLTGKKLGSRAELARQETSSREIVDLAVQHWAEATVKTKHVETAIKRIKGESVEPEDASNVLKVPAR